MNNNAYNNKEVVVDVPVVAEAGEEKVTAKKTTAKKTTKKATDEKEKKTTTKRVSKKKETVVTLEFGEDTATISAVEEKVIAQFVAEGHKASEIKTLNIYLKPFENSAYYVINENETGRVDMF